MTTSSAVECAELVVVRAGREVLHSLTCSVEAGTVTGLVGPSGCGKSTLMRSIVGVQVIRAGSVSVLGAPAGSAGLRRRIGYATQRPAVYSDLTVRENLEYFRAALQAAPGDPDRVIREVGLSEQRDQVVARLSGGQLARASLAVALLGKPELLVLDEPTVGLDPVLRDELWTLFGQLAAKGGVTLLVSSHVMEEAERCQRVVLMREGRILADDTPAALCRVTGSSNLDSAFLSLVRNRPQPEPIRS